jgi:hypothetical protein
MLQDDDVAFECYMYLTCGRYKAGDCIIWNGGYGCCGIVMITDLVYIVDCCFCSMLNIRSVLRAIGLIINSDLARVNGPYT